MLQILYVADIVFSEPENEQPSVDDREQVDGSFVRRMLHVESPMKPPCPLWKMMGKI